MAYLTVLSWFQKKGQIIYRKGLEQLKKHPEANDLKAVKKDADQALVYIKESEEKIEGKYQKTKIP
jgi:hypothetical protein